MYRNLQTTGQEVCLGYVSLFLHKKVGTHLECLGEALQAITHNIGLYGEIEVKSNAIF